MRDRIMRTIVFFDLPNIYAKDRRNYQLFRKFLLNEGFIMLQESVYSKLVLNSEQGKLLLERIRKKSPKKGIIQVLTITEKQYAQIEYIIGESNTKIINSEEKLVVL
jgi:CRISPR-associated endoribonuclease cas2